MPAEVLAVLEEHPAFGPVFSWSAEPEAKLPFDIFAGETRNSDLAVQVTDKHGGYLLAVEAKADEPFGDTLEKTLANAERRLQDNPKSNGVRRLDQLLRALLGVAGDEARQLDGLRYQLLTACAGALCEAERQGYSRTVLLIHEFAHGQDRRNKAPGKYRRPEPLRGNTLRRHCHHDQRGATLWPILCPGQAAAQRKGRTVYRQGRPPAALRRLGTPDRSAGPRGTIPSRQPEPTGDLHRYPCRYRAHLTGAPGEPIGLHHPFTATNLSIRRRTCRCSSSPSPTITKPCVTNCSRPWQMFLHRPFRPSRSLFRASRCVAI